MQSSPFIKNSVLLCELVKANVKAGVYGTYLGVLWWLIEPLLLMLIFYFVIVLVFERGGPNYHLFVLVSLVAWQAFARGVNGACNSIVSGGSLILKARISLFVLVLVPVLSNAFYAIFGVFVVVGFNGFVVHHYSDLIVAFSTLVLLSIAIGGALSLLNVYLPDTKKLTAIALRAMWFLSPVLYGVERVLSSATIPEFWKQIYMMNPMVPVLTTFRGAVLGGEYNLASIYPVFVGAVVVIVLLLISMRKNYGLIAKRI